MCQPIKINNILVPQANDITYYGQKAHVQETYLQQNN